MRKVQFCDNRECNADDSGGNELDLIVWRAGYQIKNGSVTRPLSFILCAACRNALWKEISNA
jgi:hypothetical protein